MSELQKKVRKLEEEYYCPKCKNKIYDIQMTSVKPYVISATLIKFCIHCMESVEVETRTAYRVPQTQIGDKR